MESLLFFDSIYLVGKSGVRTEFFMEKCAGISRSGREEQFREYEMGRILKYGGIGGFLIFLVIRLVF